MIVTISMPGRRKVDGKTASIIGTVVTLVPQNVSAYIEANNSHITEVSQLT